MFIALLDASKEETVDFLSPRHPTAAAVAIAQRPAEEAADAAQMLAELDQA